MIGKLIEEIEQSAFDNIFNRLIKVPAKMEHSFAPIAGNYYFLKDNSEFSNLLPDLNDDIFIDMNNAIGAGMTQFLEHSHYFHLKTFWL